MKLHGPVKAQPHWASYSFTGRYAQLLGSASGVDVWYDPGSPDGCLQNAKDLLADMPRIVAFNQGVFGGGGKGAADALVWAMAGITNGNGGADHGGCTFHDGGAIELCQSTGQSMRCSALFEAEYSECCMNGRLCGYATGEALSRWCAMAVSNNALANYATAPRWQYLGCPNFVDVVSPSDSDYTAIGCGMAFLSWLMGRHGKTLNGVARAMVHNGDSGTLAQLYGPSAWTDFMADVVGIGLITNDNPFGAPLG